MIKGTKYCCKCEEWKLIENFHINSNGIKHSYCNPCRLSYTKIKNKEYQQNKEYREIRNRRQVEARGRASKTRLCAMFNTTRFNAGKRKINFELTQELFNLLFFLQDYKCKQTGIPLDFTSMQGKRPFGPTIDRIDNSKGYTIDNVQIVCNIYNYAKNQFTHDDVIKFATALLEQQK